jgi:integrase
MRLPKYRQQLPQKIGFVEFQGKRYYFTGKYNSNESLEQYQKFVRVNCLGEAAPEAVKAGTISVAEMAALYLDFAKTYYPAGKHSEYENIRVVLLPFVAEHLEDDASTFGPKKLKAYRDSLADGSITRDYLNGIIKKIRRAFKWAVSEELIPSSVFHGLQTVGPITQGRSEAKESVPREAIPLDEFLPVHAVLHQPVKDMAMLQHLTGVRSGSLVMALPEQFDLEEDLLVWRPRFKRERLVKKTEKRKLAGKLIVYLGPEGQALLKPYLKKAKMGEYLFSPKSATTRMNRSAGEHYTVSSYRLAIRNAIIKANKLIKAENTKLPKKKQKPLIPFWVPHQIRNTKLDAVREKYDLEAAQAVGGHKKMDTTEKYARQRLNLAKKVARETG